jgi:hypothetical protein
MMMFKEKLWHEVEKVAQKSELAIDLCIMTVGLFYYNKAYASRLTCMSIATKDESTLSTQHCDHQ